jgi:lipoate-protein ligase A
MMKHWTFINDEEHSGQYNMDFDEMLVVQLLRSERLPTLRVYRWSPWAISLGYNQNLSDIDVRKCKEDGIDVVRRPTGGRAILHAEELTYSVVMCAEGSGIQHTYNRISTALVEGLARYGIDVELQKSQPDFAGKNNDSSSIPCFSSTARYEIEWKGRKLVGSAQRRYGDDSGKVVLQHGSILCGPAHRQLAEYLSLDECERTTVADALWQRTADLSEISGSPVDFHQLSLCIKSGFERVWGIEFETHHDIHGNWRALHA